MDNNVQKAKNQCLKTIRAVTPAGALGPLELDCGGNLSSYSVAYEAYGSLNEDKSNVILICHALTGDQHVATFNPVTGIKGWWEHMVGPGKILDTDRYYIICPNVLGGCMGTTGPSSINPETGTPWGVSFPVITIRDMVRAQAALMDFLAIDQLFLVIGGSMGGMQVLEWTISYPNRVFAAVPLATTAKHSPQNIAFHEVGRQAIMNDPDYCGGDYLLQEKTPSRGLAVARMTAHITYLSEQALIRKFGRRLQNGDQLAYSLDDYFQVESYLRYQGSRFVERFDANSYLYITRAMDYFDLAEAYGGVLADAFRGVKARFCLFSFSSDWLFPGRESREIVKALNAVAADVSYAEISSDKGHDAFLLEELDFNKLLSGFIGGAWKHRLRVISKTGQ